MHIVARVGNLRIGIVHGDAASLAGWRFAHDALDNPAQRSWLSDVRSMARIDLFASTHTCLAVLRDFKLASGRLTVINNGAAGMPNFYGSRTGLLSRIALTPSPHAPLYSITRDGIHVGAIPIAYDDAAFLKRFVTRWPRHSPAHASYHQRLLEGPNHTIEAARCKG
jgi:hypothetical protein